MIILVRHGERADNCPKEKPLVLNPCDPHLTKRGCLQASEAGKKIVELAKDYGQITIESSPFLRCVMTTQQICKQMEIEKFTLKTEICETLYFHFFKEDPLPQLEINSKNKNKIIDDSFQIDDQQLDTSYFPETLQNVRDRIIKKVEFELEEIQEDECKILVTHQRALKCITEIFNDISTEIGYCKIVVLKKKFNSDSNRLLDQMINIL